MPYWTGPWRTCAEPARYETMVRITPDPSWKEGSRQGTHVVSIDRLKLYHGDTTLIPNKELVRSDDEFAKHLHLAKSDNGKSRQNKGAVREKKEGGNKEESEDDSEGLGPFPSPRPTTIRPEQNTPEPGTARKRHPNTPKPKDQWQPTTPLTRAQAAIRRAARDQQNQSPTPSPPLTRAQSARKWACQREPHQIHRTARPDPGLESQPRVVLSPIDKGTPMRTPVPPDMVNYYRNYRSPGRGKSWGPTNKHPPDRPHVKYPEFPANSNLVNGRGPLPKQRRGPWQPPKPNPSVATPPQIRSLPDVSMESLSGLDAFRPRQYDEPPILEGDAPSYESSSPSDYQEASAIDPDYLPEDDDADMDDL